MNQSQYSALPGVRWSHLKTIHAMSGGSPALYRHRIDHPQEDGPDLLLGRVFHTAVLEPEVFEERHPVRPNYCTRENWGLPAALKNGYAGTYQDGIVWDDGHPDVDAASQEDVDLALLMRDAVRAHPEANRILGHGISEQAITWMDEGTGIECKALPDHLNGRLVDLKSTRHTSRRKIEGSVGEMLYHGQMAWYDAALESAGIRFEEPPVLIFVTKTDPIDVLVLPMSEEAMAAGRALYRECLDQLAECMDTGNWFGLDGGQTSEYVPPAWADPRQPQEPVELVVGGEKVTV